jgi:hypothetical protein
MPVRDRQAQSPSINEASTRHRALHDGRSQVTTISTPARSGSFTRLLPSLLAIARQGIALFLCRSSSAISRTASSVSSGGRRPHALAGVLLFGQEFDLAATHSLLLIIAGATINNLLRNPSATDRRGGLMPMRRRRSPPSA